MTSPTTPASATPATPADALHALLADAPSRPWWRRRTVWVGAALALLAVGGTALWLAQKKNGTAPRYVTEPARRGDLTLTVAANGTLQPTRSVNIGSELSGTVRRVFVDVNDTVKQGQLLVELDTAKLSSQVLRSRAAQASAHAKLAQTIATVKEAEAGLGRLEEVARLSGGKVPSAAELDAGRANLERARAEVNSARANVEDAKAALSTDETNLSKASIRSPINGTVLTRTVEPGNAVAASLQAVTLFTVAEDLSQLKLEVKVDEADVGAVQVNQPASFTVSAYPSRKYPAKITRVAYGSTATDNVVTYTATLQVDNSDLSLRPGMTASATITAMDRKDVLLVPNMALRFSPAINGGPAATKSSGGLVSQLMPRPPRSGGRKSATGAGTPGRQIWVLKDGTASAVAVTTGISDGRMTEITGGELQPGMLVITDQLAGTAP